jgi:hypothetical protein
MDDLKSMLKLGEIKWIKILNLKTGL